MLYEDNNLLGDEHLFFFFEHRCSTKWLPAKQYTTTFFRRSSKRRRIQDMMHSHTVDTLLGLVGRGRIDIACATDVARAVLKDGVVNETIDKLASVGAWGSSQSNSERDLHRWLFHAFGLNLQPYQVYVNLKVLGIKNMSFP